MKILFVCSANICRSALAEVILKKKLHEKGLTGIEVESAGIHNNEGGPRDNTMASYARKAGYELGGNAKFLTQSMTDSADLIICMEHFQMVELQRRYVPFERWRCIHRFNEFCFNEQTDLIDPSGDTGYIYHYVFEKLHEGCSTLVWKLLKLVHECEGFI